MVGVTLGMYEDVVLMVGGGCHLFSCMAILAARGDSDRLRDRDLELLAHSEDSFLAGGLSLEVEAVRCRFLQTHLALFMTIHLLSICFSYY